MTMHREEAMAELQQPTDMNRVREAVAYAEQIEGELGPEERMAVERARYHLAQYFNGPTLRELETVAEILTSPEPLPGGIGRRLIQAIGGWGG